MNHFLIKQMGENKGLWLKVGQLLSMNETSWKELEGLSEGEHIAALPLEEIQPYVEALFTQENLQFIGELADPGIPASLSQVHLWQMKEPSQKWALKVQLPGMKEVIEDQLSLLGLMDKASALRSEKKNFNTHEYHETLKQNFEQELNYRCERQNIQNLKRLSERYPLAKIPSLHPEYQGESFITMSWEEGDSWSDVLKNYSPKEKKSLGVQIITQFLYQYFCLGRSQGDFHPGNFLFQRVNEDVAITWLDLGQCLTPSLQQRRSLFLAITNFLDSSSEEKINLGPFFKAWKFNLEKLAPIADRLPLLLSRLFYPFLVNAPLNLKDWKLKSEIDTILGDDKWWFRTAGSSELFMSIRCWIGLFTMLESLQVPLNYYQIWQEVSYEIQESLPKIQLPRAQLSSVSFNDLAKKLNVKIYKEEKLSVDLNLPARAIMDIENFIKKDTLNEMKKNGISLEKIVQEQLKNGLKPCTIIDYHHSHKRYLVTLS